MLRVRSILPIHAATLVSVSLVLAISTPARAEEAAKPDGQKEAPAKEAGAAPEKPADGRPHVAPKFPMDAVAEYYKQLVPNAEVTLPGSTCATCTPQNLSPANTWTPQNLALLVERLGGAIIATHSQSGIMGHHAARILKEIG